VVGGKKKKDKAKKKKKKVDPGQKHTLNGKMKLTHRHIKAQVKCNKTVTENRPPLPLPR